MTAGSGIRRLFGAWFAERMPMMGPAVEDQDSEATKRHGMSTKPPNNLIMPSSVLVRYQHYCSELALLVLRHGHAHLELSLRLVYSVQSRCAEWLAQHPNAAKHPALLLRLVTRALHQVRHAVLQLVRPIGQFLSQLVSVQVRISTNDDLDEHTKASARVNSAVTLLFGAIKWRLHSYLQLSLPCWQPQLSPEFSLVSPSLSPYPCSSPRKHAHSRTPCRSPRAQSPSPQLSPRRMSKVQQQHQALLGLTTMPSATADSEVHVLCSSDLRSAILEFLQHQSNTHGQEFVLLRSINSNSSCGLGCRAAGPAAGQHLNRQRSSTSQYSNGFGELAGAAAASDPHRVLRAMSEELVPQGCPGYVNQSCNMFQSLTDSNLRLTQSMDGAAAELCSSYSAGDAQPGSFTFSTARRRSWSGTGGSSNGSSSSRNGSGSGSSRAEGSFSGNNTNLADAVAAVSIEGQQPTGCFSPRAKCPATAAAGMDQIAAAQGSYRQAGVVRNGSSSGFGFLDPSLAPLMSYQRSNSGSRRSGNSSYLQHNLFADEPMPQQQLRQYQPQPHQQQQQQPAMLPACPAGRQQEYYVGKEYKPARSVSPIAAPARHGVRRSSSTKKPLPPPPFVLSPRQTQQ